MLEKKNRREINWLLPLTESLTEKSEKIFLERKKERKKKPLLSKFYSTSAQKSHLFLHEQLWLWSREKIERERERERENVVCVIFASGFGASSRRRRRRRRNEGGVVEEERILFRDEASASNRREKIIVVATTEEREE